jgi:hypothetical protein
MSERDYSEGRSVAGRDYTEIKSVVPASNEGHFFATPRRPSPVAYFTIGHGFPRLAGELSALVVEDLLVDDISQWAQPGAPFAAEVFSDLAEPVWLTLPVVECSGRVELVLFNESPVPASAVVRFYWARPQE